MMKSKRPLSITVIMVISLSFSGILFFGYRNFSSNKDLMKLQSSLKEEKMKIQNLENIVDSLNNEIFIFKTNQERYEIAIEMFKSENPTSYKKLEFILNNKTE